MTQVHVVMRLERAENFATHRTKCGIRLVSEGGDQFSRAPISQGEIILTDKSAGMGAATCRRCNPNA